MSGTTPRRLTVLVTTVALLAGACGNSTGGETTTTTRPPGTVACPATAGDTTTNTPNDAPGVTDTEIRVGGVTSQTNPLGGDYGAANDGVNAFFAMTNDGGGLYGRDLVQVATLDDQVGNNQAEVQRLLAQEDIFAVLPIATLLFTGAPDLVEAGIPTFGWNIQDEWASGPNLFGEKGSVINTAGTTPSWPWLADELGVEQVGILAYGISDQSKNAAAGFRDSFEKYGGAEVVFFDDTLSFGVQDLSGEVAEMKARGVDMVMSAMDQTGVRTLQLEMRRQDMDAFQYLSNAYDPAFVAEFGELFAGSYVGIQYWPMEETTDAPQGLTDYLAWMETTGGTVNELSITGWLLADLFVEGLTAAGPGFSQQRVIDCINEMTDWDADGFNPGFDWTIAHDQEQLEGCFATLRIDDGGYTPVFGEPGMPFVCLDNFAETMPEARITD